MILRLVLCFCFLCFVDCDPWEVTTEDNTAQPQTNCSNAENISETSSQCNETESTPDKNKLPGDNSTETRTASKEQEIDFQIETVAEQNAAKQGENGDQYWNKEQHGRQFFEIPEIPVNRYPQKVFDSNENKCFSALSVKMIVKKVLEHVKEHPYALDLIINEIQSEIEEKPHLFKFQDYQNNDAIASLLDTRNKHKSFDIDCPLSIVRFLEQMPKFISQIRKFPQCLLHIFGCHNEFKVPSASSDFCGSLPNILKTYKISIPRPHPKPIPEFVSPTHDLPFEFIKDKLQLYAPELNNTDPEPEIEPDYIEPQNSPQEQPTLSKHLPKKIITKPEIILQWDVLPQEQIRPQQEQIEIDVPEPFIRPSSHVNIQPKPETIVEPEIFYIEKPKPIYIEEEIPTYVQEHEPINIQEPEPVNVKYPDPIYIENLGPIYIENSEPIHVEEPKTIYVEEPVPIYVEEPKPVVKSFYIEEPKPIYIEDTKPKYLQFETEINANVEKPIYVKEPTPIYEKDFSPEYTVYLNLDDVKENPKPMYVEEPKPVYVEELKPVIEPIHIKESKPIYLEQPEPIYVEGLKPVIEPIYVEGSKPIDAPQSEPIYVQELKPVVEPGYIVESKPTYVEKPESVYVEESKPAIEPIYIDEPEPVYVEESKPISVEEVKPLKSVPKPVPIYFKESKPYIEPIYIEKPEPAYIEKPKPMSIEEPISLKPVPVYIKEPKNIYVQEPEPIYIEESKPYMEPIYIEKPMPKPIYVEHTKTINSKKPKFIHFEKPKYVDVNEPEHIYVEGPKPVSAEELEPIYVEESKPDIEPIYIDEPEPVYVEESKPISVEEVESLKPVPKPVPNYFEESKPYIEPIYIEKPELKPIYIEDTKNINIKKPKLIDPKKPFSVHVENSEPIYVEESEPIYVEEPEPIYVEEPKPIYIEDTEPRDIKEPKLIPIEEPAHIKQPEPIYIKYPKPIPVEESKPLKPLPIYVKELETVYLEEPEPIYFEESIPKPINEPQPVYVEESTSVYEKKRRPAYTVDLELDYIKVKPKPIVVEEPEPIYIDKPKPFIVEEPNIYIKKSKPIHIKKPETVYVAEPEPVYDDEPEPIYVEKEPIYIKRPKPTYTEKSKQMFGYGSSPTNVKDSKLQPKLKPDKEYEPFYIDDLDLDFTKEPQPMYIEDPEAVFDKTQSPIYVDESIPELINKPQHMYAEESTPVYEKETSAAYTVDLKLDYIKVKPKPIAIENPEPVYMEEPEPIYLEDPNIYFERPKPIHIQKPEITYIEKPSSVEQPAPVHISHTPKEQPTHEIYVHIIPANVVQEIIQLIKDNPRKQINNIIRVLKQNQSVIKPQLYKILFSIVNALIKGKVDSERFNEIVYTLIQPQINSEWKIEKTQTLYNHLLPGKTEQVETSILDVIHGLIHQPENDSKSPVLLDLILPLLKKIKTGHVDHRINDIILALLNRHANKEFSIKEVEILLKFIKPNKMGHIPKKYIDIALMLVNFDKIPYFSLDNIKSIFLLIKRNKTGKIDQRAIEILHDILLPKKLIFLTEQNIIDILTFLGTDPGEYIHPKRLDIVRFLLKNIPHAPIIIDCLIKSLKDYDFVHSKFVDIILYLDKKKILSFKLLEALVSLLSQETTGNLDKKILNNLLLLLEPYRNSHPKVVIDVYHLLNLETYPTQNDMSKIPDNLKVLMYYLMNSGTNQFDQYQGYNEREQKNLLSKVLQRLQWEQNREYAPELLERNNGYIELTYMLKDQEPLLYHPVYYVKYKIPMTNFSKNVKDLIANNPQLITDPAKLLRELINAGRVSEVSPNLIGFRKEDILKLTFEDGNLIQAKVLDEKRINLNDQIKLVQDFNSDITPQEILQQNEMNAAKYYTTYGGKRPNLAGIGSIFNGGSVGRTDSLRPMNLKKSKMQSINQFKRSTYNSPLSYEQRRSTWPLLTDVDDINDKKIQKDIRRMKTKTETYLSWT